MSTVAQKRIGHCVVCKLPNPDRRKDFVCVECVDTENTLFVCDKCGRREKFSVENIAHLSEVLGESVVLDHIEGAIVVTTCCAQCEKLFGGRRTTKIFYISVGGNN